MRNKTIDLIPPEGWIGGNTFKSMSISSPISASINGSLLHVQCSSPPIMDVTVCIIQNGVIAYQKTVPAAETNHIWIDLSNYAEGMYVLDLTNSLGGYVYGEFVL